MSEAGVNLWDTAAHALEIPLRTRTVFRIERKARRRCSSRFRRRSRACSTSEAVMDACSALVRLARQGGRAVALDFSETMIERLRARVRG